MTPYTSVFHKSIQRSLFHADNWDHCNYMVLYHYCWFISNNFNWRIKRCSIYLLVVVLAYNFIPAYPIAELHKNAQDKFLGHSLQDSFL